MSSSWFLTGACEKIVIEGEIGGKSGVVCTTLKGIGRKLARSTVHRTTSEYYELKIPIIIIKYKINKISVFN